MAPPDGVDLLGYCVGRDVRLGLDVSQGAFVSPEGLHHVDDLEESVGPVDRKEGQHGLVVGVCLIANPVGDQDAVEPVIGLHGEGGLVVLWGPGMTGFGHGETVEEECGQEKGVGTSWLNDKSALAVEHKASPDGAKALARGWASISPRAISPRSRPSFRSQEDGTRPKNRSRGAYKYKKERESFKVSSPSGAENGWS